MSCSYFILTQNSNYVDDNTKNQIYFLNNQQTYILPQNNINYYINNGLFESNLIEWCRQFCSSDKIFLDIGAHTGTYSIALANSCKHVYSFEPQKMTYYALCGSVALSNKKNITCLQYGLGNLNQEGIQKLKIISNDGGGSSLHAKENIIREEEIEVKVMDKVGLDGIGFIKMDVEDNEIHVIEGGIETIKRSNYPPILFESNCGNDSKICKLLKELGYKIININGYSNMFLANY